MHITFDVKHNSFFIPQLLQIMLASAGSSLQLVF